MHLREYQVKAIDDVRQAYVDGARRPLLVAPCGAGKTVIFSHIGKAAAERGKRVMILVHRQELLDQVSASLERCNVPHGMIASQYGSAPNAAVQVASVKTLANRLDRTQPPHVLIIDEAHHAGAATWEKVIGAYPKARLLGVTATPTRQGGGGLGDIFDRLIMGPSVRSLTEGGFLSRARVFAPPTINTDGMHTLMGDYLKSEVKAAVDKPSVTGNAIEHYQRLTPGQKAVVFCVSLEHAATIAEGARAAGISALTVDGKMDRDIRRRIIEDFVAGKIQWLVTVDLVSEGWDVPSIEVGIFLRPTQSLGLWLQQAGRVIRAAPGKAQATILDHGGNFWRFGNITEDEWVDLGGDREWKLEGADEQRAKKERVVSMRVCPKCFSAQAGGKTHCVHCGHKFPAKSRKVQKSEGDLAEVTAEDLARRRERQAIGMAASQGNRAKLEEIARIKGYKPGWVEHRLGASRYRRKQA